MHEFSRIELLEKIARDYCLPIDELKSKYLNNTSLRRYVPEKPVLSKTVIDNHEYYVDKQHRIIYNSKAQIVGRISGNQYLLENIE